ncbi:mechanosensitive ion channel family protein [Colwellia psychrerythraea]|uniref:Small-conductance mechanosensitive channel n=1 Tax=Colwellia psychrerythraea TaxID=28229 RepID=A0A099KZ85_COLPS|nr:mechanosensitive ion channel family protein [Colwellia psychrerythraea]KGJ95112.1 MscS Mechanosensitive ion channel [Colwellia psychrerythraea]
MTIFKYPKRLKQLMVIFLSLICLSLSATSLAALAVDDGKPYQASTTKNANIDLGELEFTLVPLTKAELAVEVDAWLTIVKHKATIVSEAEILVSQKQRKILAAQEISSLSADSAELILASKENQGAAEELKEDLAEINTLVQDLEHKKSAQTSKAIESMDKTPESFNELAIKAEQYSDKLQGKRQYLIKSLTQLREEKNDALERFLLVIKNWESKGGDAAELHLYANALTGTTVDLTDSDAAWLTIKGWMLSQDGGLRWLANIIKFFLALLFVYILSRTAGKLTDAALNRNRNLSTLLKLFIKVSVRRVILMIGFIVSLTFIEINVGPVLALIGAAGLVVGLALQSTLSNFASGMLILIYRPFDVGDIIEIDGVTGTVHSMTLLSTSIKTFDNQHLVVPNNNIWGTTIVNVTGSKTRRVDLVFGIGYGDDMAKAERIMLDVVKKHELVLELPAPVVKVNQLADSSVNFVCRPWVKTENYLDVYWDITRQVKEEFDKQGVSIPFPQRDVHIHQPPSIEK